jgi:hypothetical protein
LAIIHGQKAGIALKSAWGTISKKDGTITQDFPCDFIPLFVSVIQKSGNTDTQSGVAAFNKDGTRRYFSLTMVYSTGKVIDITALGNTIRVTAQGISTATTQTWEVQITGI